MFGAEIASAYNFIFLLSYTFFCIGPGRATGRGGSSKTKTTAGESAV
jgi:hypothetical protein